MLTLATLLLPTLPPFSHFLLLHQDEFIVELLCFSYEQKNVLPRPGPELKKKYRPGFFCWTRSLPIERFFKILASISNSNRIYIFRGWVAFEMATGSGIVLPISTYLRVYARADFKLSLESNFTHVLVELGYLQSRDELYTRCDVFSAD